MMIWEGGKMRYIGRSAISIVFFVIWSLAFPTHAQETDPRVDQARQLLDIYYGESDILERSGRLIGAALQSNGNNAEALIQAARLTVKGGYISDARIVEGTLELCHGFLDRAITIEPNLAQAYQLKAELYDLQDNYPRERAALEKAKELNDSDPWLWLGYGRYYRNIDQLWSARLFYERVKTKGPGKSIPERKAYVTALEQIATILPLDAPVEEIRALALAANAERYPTNAWVLGNFAGSFFVRGYFDDAIDYARQALKVSNYGNARLALATGLYSKAAWLMVNGQSEAQVKPLVEEARKLGFGREAILNRATRGGSKLEPLIPTLTKIVRQ